MISTSLRPTGVPLRLKYTKSNILPPAVRLDVLGGYKDDGGRLFVLCRCAKTEQWPAYDATYCLVGDSVKSVGCDDAGYLEDFDRETFGRLADYDPFKLAGKVYRKLSHAEIRSSIGEREFAVK